MRQNLNNLGGVLAVERATGISCRWLQAEAEAGRLPAIDVGKNTFLFHLPTVMAALEKRAAAGENMNVANEGDDED